MTGLLILLAAIQAQDARTIVEPTIPPSCAVLQATRFDESKPDTARIQQALDRCGSGKSVTLEANGRNNTFLTGPLELRAGVTLVVASNTILYGSRNPRDYDVSRGACGIVDHSGRGCKPLIAANNVAGAGVMGEGTIDGRGGEKLLNNNVSWWDLAQQAKVTKASQNCPRLLVLTHADNFTLYRITLRNSGNFHVLYNGGNGFTAWGVTIDTPATARNTDGINPSNATNVTITRSFIHTGDDNVAIKAGGPSSHITISDNHFYTGHGMSIGSETMGDASAIRVTNLSIDGADNGIRIKSNASRGGIVRDVVYEDVCIRNTKNPILFDTHYSSEDTVRDTAKDKIPDFRDITLHNVRVLTPGKITLDGFDDAHRLGILFDNVALDTPSPITAHLADLEMRPGEANSCAGKFVPMPRKGVTP